MEGYDIYLATMACLGAIATGALGFGIAKVMGEKKSDERYGQGLKRGCDDFYYRARELEDTNPEIGIVKILDTARGDIWDGMKERDSARKILDDMLDNLNEISI